MSKNIFVSNSGSYLASPASYDDNSALSSSVKISANTASFAGQSGILQIKNNILTTVADGTAADSGSVLAYTQGVGFEPKQIETPQLSGDIIGNNISGVRVKNISNVSSGILSSSIGGLGTSSYAQNSIIITSGNGPVYGEQDKILAVVDNNGTWGFTNKNILEKTILTEPLVYLFTGSQTYSYYSTFIIGGQYTWTKPQNCRYIRIICQGGGGGGGCGGGATDTPYPGGDGGGAGGFSDVILNADSVSNTVTVTVGDGGRGGQYGGANDSAGQNRGVSGAASSFGNHLSALGGIGGRGGS